MRRAVVLFVVLLAGCADPAIPPGRLQACLRVRGSDVACASTLSVLYDGGTRDDARPPAGGDAGFAGSGADGGIGDAGMSATDSGSGEADGGQDVDGGAIEADAGASDGGAVGVDAAAALDASVTDDGGAEIDAEVTGDAGAGADAGPWRLACEPTTHSLAPPSGPAIAVGSELRLELRAESWRAFDYIDLLPSPSVSVDGQAPGVRVTVRTDSRGSALRSLSIVPRAPGEFAIVVAPRTGSTRDAVRAHASAAMTAISRVIPRPRLATRSRYAVEVCTARAGDTVEASVNAGSADSMTMTTASTGSACPEEFAGVAVVDWEGNAPSTEWLLTTTDSQTRATIATPERVTELALTEATSSSIPAGMELRATRLSARILARVSGASCTEVPLDGAPIALRPADSRVSVTDVRIATDASGRFSALLSSPADVAVIPLIVVVDGAFTLPWDVPAR